MTMHQRAREVAMPVECKKDVLKQNQDGTWKLTLTIAPDGLPDEIMRALPGTRYQTAFVEVGDDEQPVAKAPPEKPPRPFHDLPLSQQAGIRCGDEGFRRFLYDYYVSVWGTESSGLNTDEENAAAVVRKQCRVGSRAEFDTFPKTGSLWITLNAEYEQWAGLSTEQR